jgi:hypothetical protein
MSAGFNTTTLPDLTSKDASFDAARFVLTNHRIMDKPGKWFPRSGLLHVLHHHSADERHSLRIRAPSVPPLGIADLAWGPTRKT